MVLRQYLCYGKSWSSFCGSSRTTVANITYEIRCLCQWRLRGESTVLKAFSQTEAVLVQIRLFGDPQVYSDSDTPVLSLSLSVELEKSSFPLKSVSYPNVFPDFVNGWAFGDAMGIFMRSTSSKWWSIVDVVLAGPSEVDFSHRRLIPSR